MSDRRPTGLRFISIPLDALHPFLAGQESLARPPFIASRPSSGAGRSPPILRQPSRPRWARPKKPRRKDYGSDRQLHPRRPRRLRRHDQDPQPQRQGNHKACDRDNYKASDHSVTANGVEFGAGWSRTARETGAEYLSLKLDDPSFTAPVYASLPSRSRAAKRLPQGCFSHSRISAVYAQWPARGPSIAPGCCVCSRCQITLLCNLSVSNLTLLCYCRFAAMTHCRHRAMRQSGTRD
jgi:hypothetical protein